MPEREPLHDPLRSPQLDDMGISPQQRQAIEEGITIFEHNGVISQDVADQMRLALIVQDPHIRAREVRNLYTRRKALLLGGGFIAGLGVALVSQRLIVPQSQPLSPPTPETEDNEAVIPAKVKSTPTPIPTPTLSPEQIEIAQNSLTTVESIKSLNNWTISYDPYNPAITYALDGPVNTVKSGETIRIHRPFAFDLATNVVMMSNNAAPEGYMTIRVLGSNGYQDWYISDPTEIRAPDKQPDDIDRRVIVFKGYDENDTNKPPKVSYVEITHSTGLADSYLVKYMKRIQR